MAFILKRAIESIDYENSALGGLKKKLYSVYDFKRVTDVVVHPNQLNIVNDLIEAIEYKEQKQIFNAGDKFFNGRISALRTIY